MRRIPPPGPRPQVAVREPRQNLSCHLQRVAEGVTLEVTAHGTTGRGAGPLPETQSAFDRLISQGRVVPARLARSGVGTLVDPPPGVLSISHALSAERSLSLGALSSMRTPARG